MGAAGAPAWGQTAAPPVGPTAGIAQDVASIPVLSGRWAHPYLTGFEPPRSGPGPVRNKSRLPNGVANFQQLVGDYTNPILKPQAAEVVQKHGEISLAGGGYPTPSNQCWPQGGPYIFWDFLMGELQKPDKVVLIYRHGNEGGQFDANYRGKVLQLHFTVEDESIFTMPWTATITYRPAVGPRTDPHMRRKSARA